MMGRVGVAISTTGDEHRLKFLETCAAHWGTVEGVDSLFVTVDGDEAACERAAKAVSHWTASVWRVGQGPGVREGRMGVAVNKNTGLELLMNASVGASYPNIEHLFLCDDDTWPRGPQSIRLHTEGDLDHSMVAWGRGRLIPTTGAISYARWTWPRGVMLYTHRSVLVSVGGMDERFGPGGHEHAEWSRRIHQKGITPHSFCSPSAYAESSEVGSAMGAYAFWNCEDMPRPGEAEALHRARKRGQGTVRREKGDWTRINKLMEEHDGNPTFIPFRADANGRESATLCSV